MYMKSELGAQNFEGIPQFLPYDEDEAHIDALIAKFRAQSNPDIDEILSVLQPLTHKFTGQGRKEEKVESFLKEVIAQYQQNQLKQQSEQTPQPQEQ